MPVKIMNNNQRRAQPLQKKMNAEEEDLDDQERMDLVLCKKTAEKLLGPEPIPSLDIDMDEIKNELQKKLAEEIQCAVCY